MAGLLLSPQYQFVDANGVPYVGGMLSTYVPNSFTPKETFQNASETTANSNPIVLDSRGTCVVYGDGDYRVILADQFGNQIFDLVTTEPLPADAISPAMLPVVGASTLAQALTLMGVYAAIDAAISAINLMTGPTGWTGPTGATGQIGGTGPTGPGGTPTSSRGNPSFWYDPITGYLVQFGNATADGTGLGTITFPKLFTLLQSIQVTLWPPSTQNDGAPQVSIVNLNAFECFFLNASGGIPNRAFSWVACGFG